MLKNLICIECPKSCALDVDIENCRVVKVTGRPCPKGEKYAVSEIEDPRRILTGTILTKGFVLKLLPVRTDKPIPKSHLLDAMKAIRNLRITQRVKTGDVIVKDFLGLGANLIATRDIEA
jgi:CxxC motif-containing protein